MDMIASVYFFYCSSDRSIKQGSLYELLKMFSYEQHELENNFEDKLNKHWNINFVVNFQIWRR